MDGLLEQFGELVCDIARDMQGDGYFTGSQELGEGHQKFLRDVLQQQLPKAELHRALYGLTKVVAKLTRRSPIVLIDEYDTPTLYAVQNNYFPDVRP